MALTEKVRLALEAQSFDRLYDQQEQIWKDLADHARNLIKPHVRNETPTVDDIKKVLLPLVEINRHYRRFTEGNARRSQLHWAERFTDYVLDRVYEPTLNIDVENGEEGENDD
jgi:hypothetical protein